MAVVSGRAGEDVRARVGVDGVVCVGSHGLELEPQADRWRRTLAAFAADAPWPPQEIEVKGLAVAFHFRGRADERQAVRELDAIAESAREEGLVARYGRKVLEVLPPVGSHKGTAVRRLLEEHGLRRALAAGDDTTDLDSFAALDGLEVAVRVPSRRPRRRARCSTPPTSSSVDPTEFLAALGCGETPGRDLQTLRCYAYVHAHACRRSRSRSSCPPISDVSKRMAMIAFAPFAFASSIIRSITCSRLSVSAFVIPFSSPPTIDLRPAPICEPMLRERTVSPITSPNTSSTS